jgi:catechol 2,3-dioxygenase-like lactoylglutathione lyase family enzyme
MAAWIELIGRPPSVSFKMVSCSRRVGCKSPNTRHKRRYLQIIRMLLALVVFMKRITCIYHGFSQNGKYRENLLVKGQIVRVVSLDHLVITVQDIPQAIKFYVEILGMTEVTFGDNRKALSYGQQKINLHKFGEEFEPKAAAPLPGSADLCFIIDGELEEFIEHLNDNNIEILQGPISRTGALGVLNSVYVRDPDQNLIELSSYSL